MAAGGGTVSLKDPAAPVNKVFDPENVFDTIPTI
jgi:hypothetical protein